MPFPSPEPISVQTDKTFGPRVLLVDDDLLTRTRLAKALRQRGYRVVETPSRLFGALMPRVLLSPSDNRISSLLP